jgi:hypothetical protein
MLKVIGGPEAATTVSLTPPAGTTGATPGANPTATSVREPSCV